MEREGGLRCMRILGRMCCVSCCGYHGPDVTLEQLVSSRETMVRCCCALMCWWPLKPLLVTAINALIFSIAQTLSFYDLLP